MRRLVAGAVAALAVLGCPAVAKADGFSGNDLVGDSGGAPDVTALSAWNTPDGQITFEIATNASSLTGDQVVWLVLSTDDDGSTGNEYGFDYYLGIDGSGWTFGKYTGTEATDTTVSQETVRATYEGGLARFSLNRREIGNATSLEFYVESDLVRDEQTIESDYAPNDTTWEYALSLPRGPRTFSDAPSLRSRVRYDGESIKHTRIGENLYATMKKLGAPRVVTVACWSKRDWPSVLGSTALHIKLPRPEEAIVDGFWLGIQPRWLHLSPNQCGDIQALLDTRRPNGQRAYALATALHERVHAHGVDNEALTTCLSVQLVYAFAREMSFVHAKALYLEALAVRKTRATVSRGYWDPTRCRDGGKWDLFRGFRNLDY